MVDGLRLLQFRDHRSVAAVANNDLLHHIHIGRRAHERDCHCIDAMGEAELEILTIFFGHGGNRQRGAGEIDALVLADKSAIQNVAEHIFAAHGAHAEFDQTVT